MFQIQSYFYCGTFILFVYCELVIHLNPEEIRDIINIYVLLNSEINDCDRNIYLMALKIKP